jgi:hypothetical protein
MRDHQCNFRAQAIVELERLLTLLFINLLKEVLRVVKRYRLNIERFNSFSRCSLTMFRLR